jgi:hypothetical protein
MGLELVSGDQVVSSVNEFPHPNRMSIRTSVLKRLLFRLLLAVSLLAFPILVWAQFSQLAVVLSEAGSARTEAGTEAFSDDAEFETLTEQAGPASRTRSRAGRGVRKAVLASERAEVWQTPSRVTLVIDVRRVKPKRLFAPPYLRPRVVRLLS